MATKEVETANDPSVILLLQQCKSAKLLVKPPSSEDANDSEFVNIGKGIVVYVSFLKSTTPDSVKRAASLALGVKLTHDEETSKLKSALDANGDVLIVPQACLGGKVKGKSFQYHNLMGRDACKDMYQAFIDACAELLASSKSTGALRHGTYGNRQALNIDSDGPYTHIIDL